MFSGPKPIRAKRDVYEKSTLQTDNYEDILNWFYEETEPQYNKTFKKIAHMKEPINRIKRDSESAPTIISLDDVFNAIGVNTNGSFTDGTVTPNHIDNPDSGKSIDDFLQILALEEGKETKSPLLDVTTKEIVNFSNDYNKIDNITVPLDTYDLNEKGNVNNKIKTKKLCFLSVSKFAIFMV